ncbi:MAG TPA: tRNA (guanosine(46)-N7)-methyltransferase TrmB [Gemmatales bacterium]|mgnify:CR=1 FL=1|nr:tRNA (guanosine(46)-N7)-methyltransferase TrmB [Gemmatales bacterium]HMP58218.1 tRNA (guanosine(46)-N7)-methyltransferase TrmB [Gemmatales bacterium]
MTPGRRRQWPLAAIQPFQLELPSPLPETPWLDGPALFGNDQPFEIEIGCGKGGFLVGRALQVPEHNFLGIELDRGLFHYIATRLARRQLWHVRILQADASRFLAQACRSACVAHLHVYCPDPWWKRRHHKRRLFTPEFVANCQRVLAPGGKLHLASDVADYFDLMTRLVRDHTALMPMSEEVSVMMAGIGPTNFERKGVARGHVMGRATFAKAAPAGSVDLALPGPELGKGGQG